MKILFSSFLCISICFGTEKISVPLFFEYHIVDTERQEICLYDKDHPFRELMMHVWIPQDQQRQYPLILFSHGLGETYNGMTYTYLCEKIACQGYIVASVSHSYGCKDIQFPDDRIVLYNFLERMKNCYHNSSHMFDGELHIWAADMITALQECEHYNFTENNYLYNKIDFSQIGIIGHSLGGSTAMHMCAKNSRIKVAINLDGPILGNQCTCNKPLLCIIGSSVLMHQETVLGKVPLHPALMWRYYFNQAWLPSLNKFIDSSPHAQKIVIDGIIHDTFTDYAFTHDPIIQPWLMDGVTAQDTIANYVCDFLSCHLKN